MSVYEQKLLTFNITYPLILISLPINRPILYPSFYFYPFFILRNYIVGVMLLRKIKIGIAKEQEFVLRNWSYYELQTKIKYKAEKAGIELIIG